MCCQFDHLSIQILAQVDKIVSITADSNRQVGYLSLPRHRLFSNVLSGFALCQLRGKDGLDPQLQKLFGQGNRNEEGETGAEPLRNKGGKMKNKLGRKPDASAEPSENGYKPEGSAGGLKGGKKRKGGKRKGSRAGAEGAADAEEEGEERRMLLDEEDRSEEAEARRQELRAKKHEEIHARYKERRQNEEKSREESIKHRKASRERENPSGRRDSVEDYMAQRHKEMRERHTRDRGRDRSNPSGRRERHKRPESDGRHAVLRRRVVKHEHLFTPEELAEIHEDLNDHKVDEDRLDAARDKLNSEFDALREIDDRDERLEQLEVLKAKRAATRDADRLARDALRERFQTIRDKLEAKLKTEL